ncbi:hypothetical protein PTTG_29240 [Puccinia triticina 1-1 BBBD Race 1]|uniref:Helicase ATP-binding domain-containing protein n=1 Tax=Puccinia triticina (isolate 1-1 / race 1 (BBBD)) TaxID=630390 RepID=A0A180G5F5_PUCT1|nr:hypothetical protein PTTG_29240 [Puccinia triticina 1-1 BBBD Race 1]
MGLGKTLKSLTFILASANSAVQFQWEDWITQSAATLVICPLATLLNWEHEIRLHFWNDAITYHVFHGPSRKQLTRQDLQLALVVLTTYEMIGESGNMLQPNQLTIASLNLYWYRFVLDEAHLMRNPAANRTQNIQQLKLRFVLCLTGTPVKNRLTNLQSLITTLQIAPRDNELIWKKCLIPQMNVGAPEAIQSLNQLMILSDVARDGRNYPESFMQDSSGRLGDFVQAGEPWDPAEFFRQLTRLCQFCNHPIFARSEMPLETTWRWEDSGKIMHLVSNLQAFLSGVRGIDRPKAVVFLSYVEFLDMLSVPNGGNKEYECAQLLMTSLLG